MSLTDEAGEPLTAQQIDSAMDTGQGADDEPEMNIGDRYAEKYGDELPEDAGGGGTPSLEKAARLYRRRRGKAKGDKMTDYTMDTTPDMDADLRHEDELRQSQSKWEGVFGKPNVAMPERIASSLAGAALATYAITKKRDAGGAALALAGGMLLYRGVTGQCMGYAVMRTGTAKDESNDTAVIPHGRGIKVEKSVTIQKTADELFDFWRDFTNLPRFMAHLESVTIQDETRSHWVAKAPLGKTVEWDAEIINEKPGEMIAWRSTDNADIPNTGSVWFRPLPAGRGTMVKVSLKYDPPAGVLGATIARWFGEEPGHQVDDDLRHFKNLMEAGEIPTIAGQPQGNRNGYSSSKPLMPTH